MSCETVATADVSSLDQRAERGPVMAPARPMSAHRLLALTAWLFVGGSILARLVRYLRCPPLWGDEHFQAAAFLDHGYFDLLGTLPYEQVAPVGFLWIELTFVKLLGFHEWSLRLFPLLAGIGSVLLFHHVSRRLLGGISALLAVAAFCSTYMLIRYSCEVKPYGTDVFVSMGLIALLVEWRRNVAQVGWLWLLVAATPIALCLSFPAVFVAGAISLALVGPVWQARERRTWTAYLTFNFLLGATFAGLQCLILSRHYDGSTSFMLPFWTDGFMPVAEPWRIPWWLLQMHTGDMFSYPLGGPHFLSSLTTICCGVGLWRCWGSQRSLVYGFVGMLGLALIAAALQRYPYGVHPRVVLYAAAPICLAFGAGAGFMLEKLGSDRWRTITVWFLVAGMTLILAVPIARDVVRPYRTIHELQHRDFARRLWTADPAAEVCCVRGDLGFELYAHNADSAYRCNWGTFHRVPTLTPGKDLHCVVFHSEHAVLDQAKFDAWMARMLAQYDLIGREQHRTAVSGDGRNGYYDVYRFRPRRGATVS